MIEEGNGVQCFECLNVSETGNTVTEDDYPDCPGCGSSNVKPVLVTDSDMGRDDAPDNFHYGLSKYVFDLGDN